MKRYKKCPECGTLNLNRDYCKNCGALIDLNKRRKLKKEKQKANKKPISKTPNKITLFFENAKDHKNIFIRLFARFFYSVWVLVIVIAGIFGIIILYAAA